MKFIYTKTFAASMAALVIVVILLFLQVKGWLQPLENVLLRLPRSSIAVAETVIKPLKGFTATIYSLRKISQENKMLHGQILDLQQQVVVFNQLRLENESLKKQLDFKATTNLTLQPCTVLSLNPQGLTDAVIISCGSGDGVREGQGIISEGYLVGKIIHVGSSTSTAFLLTNPQLSVDVKISRSSTEGLVTGSFGSGIVLSLLSQNADVKSGDIVATAGINGFIPKNILVGQVGQDLSDKNDLFKKTTLTSPINFNDISFVFVAK